jgi:post-segregation antitoxin (ccd killing protein)
MPKVNIYLPDDLAIEARDAKLSLSPICQQAIREELDRMKAQQETDWDIEAVASRLMGTPDNEYTQRKAAGRADGMKWARDDASINELRWLTEDGRRDTYSSDEFPTLCDFMSRKENQFFGAVVADLNDAYWIGFEAGAYEVWEKVKPLL